MFFRPEGLGGMGGRGQYMLAVPFLYLHLGNFGSIQQFACFDVLSLNRYRTG